MPTKKNWIQDWNDYEKQKRKNRIASRKRRRIDGIVGQVIEWLLSLLKKR
jgi:hypothetical protein